MYAIWIFTVMWPRGWTQSSMVGNANGEICCKGAKTYSNLCVYILPLIRYDSFWCVLFRWWSQDHRGSPLCLSHFALLLRIKHKTQRSYTLECTVRALNIESKSLARGTRPLKQTSNEPDKNHLSKIYLYTSHTIKKIHDNLYQSVQIESFQTHASCWGSESRSSIHWIMTKSVMIYRNFIVLLFYSNCFKPMMVEVGIYLCDLLNLTTL